MIGKTVECRAPKSIAAWLLLGLALLLLIWAAYLWNAHLLLAAFLPLCIGLALWFGRPAGIVLTVEQHGLAIFGSHQEIPFSSIREIVVGESSFEGGTTQLPNLPIEIHHDAGVLVLPQSMSLPREELLDSLIARLSAPASRPPHAALADFFQQQCEKFGSEKVHVVHTRKLRIPASKLKRDRAVCIALVVIGAVWIVGSLAAGPFHADGEMFGGWLIAGAFLVVAGWLMIFHLRSAGKRAVNPQLVKFPNSCMVVSPEGLAMTQGDLQGVLRWGEITKASARFSQWMRASRTSGLQLLIRGGEILVLDIYERSPKELEQLVQQHLVGPNG